MPEIHEIQYRSEEVQEIIGQMPGWLGRWGVYIVCSAITLLLIGAGYLKFPDTITGNVTISSENPPVKLVTRTSGLIEKILVGNGADVKRGQIVCILSNAASYGDITILRSALKSVDRFDDIINVNFPNGLQVGELQGSYLDLLEAVQQYKFFLSHNNYRDRVSHLTSQMSVQMQLGAELLKRDSMLQKQLYLQRNLHAIDSTLISQKVISKVEFEEAEKRLLDQQIQTQSNYSNILQSLLQQKEYERNIGETILQFSSEENNLRERLRIAIRQLESQLAQWSEDYEIVSPVEGTLVYFKVWNNNQYVQTGEGLFMVTPIIQNYRIRASLGVIGAGKISPGQPVLIRLAAYPATEYGMLRGRILERSSISMDSSYSLEINLVNGLTTTMGKLIPDQAQLEGVCEIMTDDKSVLQRLFQSVNSSWAR